MKALSRVAAVLARGGRRPPPARHVRLVYDSSMVLNAAEGRELREIQIVQLERSVAARYGKYIPLVESSARSGPARARLRGLLPTVIAGDFVGTLGAVFVLLAAAPLVQRLPTVGALDWLVRPDWPLIAHAVGSLVVVILLAARFAARGVALQAVAVVASRIGWSGFRRPGRSPDRVLAVALQWAVALCAAATSLALVLLFVSVVNDEVFKPALGLSRPEGYDPSSETGLAGVWHRAFGGGQGAPSGFMVRQSVLLGLAIWLSQPSLRWMRARVVRWGVRVSQVGLVVTLAAARLASLSHDPFDILLGLAFGILLFWSLVLPIAATLHEDARLLLPLLATTWFVVTIALVFVSRSPAAWLMVGLVVTIAAMAVTSALKISPRPAAS